MTIASPVGRGTYSDMKKNQIVHLLGVKGKVLRVFNEEGLVEVLTTRFSNTENEQPLIALWKIERLDK